MGGKRSLGQALTFAVRAEKKRKSEQVRRAKSSKGLGTPKKSGGGTPKKRGMPQKTAGGTPRKTAGGTPKKAGTPRKTAAAGTPKKVGTPSKRAVCQTPAKAARSRSHQESNTPLAELPTFKELFPDSEESNAGRGGPGNQTSAEAGSHGLELPASSETVDSSPEQRKQQAEAARLQALHKKKLAEVRGLVRAVSGALQYSQSVTRRFPRAAASLESSMAACRLQLCNLEAVTKRSVFGLGSDLRALDLQEARI